VVRSGSRRDRSGRHGPPPETNPDLTNVEGDYPPDARLVVTIDVVDDDEYDGGGTVRSSPNRAWSTAAHS
jgi:hypothetical protein